MKNKEKNQKLPKPDTKQNSKNVSKCQKNKAPAGASPAPAGASPAPAGASPVPPAGDIPLVPDYVLMDGDRTRSASIELYAPPSQWGTLLNECEYYAYIYHDKDIKADGTPKTPHYHLLVRFSNARYVRAIKKYTNLDTLDENTTMLFQKIKDKNAIVNYLTHDTKQARKDGKHVYDLNEVVTNDWTYWSMGKSEDDESFLEDLCNKELSYRHLAIKYGKGYMLNFRKYEDFIQAMEKDENERNLHVLRKEVYDKLNESSNAIDMDSLLVEYCANIVLSYYHSHELHSTDIKLLIEEKNKFLNELNTKITDYLYGEGAKLI